MKKFLDKLTKTHLYWDVCVFVVTFSVLLVRWDMLATYQRCAYILLIIMCFHQIEEYRLPGGFVWGYNEFMKSTDPIRYPGNRLNASFVDILSFILALPPLLCGCSEVLCIFFAIFAILESVMHLLFGIDAYRRYHSKGKDTLYFPGNATAFFGFLPISIVTLIELSESGKLTGDLLLGGFLVLVVYMALGWALPNFALQDKNSPYIYTNVPVEGYFHKFI